MSAAGTVLVINSGSSSIKYQLLDPRSGVVLAAGLVERIGEGEAQVKHTAGAETTRQTREIADHEAGLRVVLELFGQIGPDLSGAGIVAVGHRVVQGGRRYSAPVLIDQAVEQEIERLSPVAPLHNPPNLAGIRVARELLPDVPHVAVFDTAFFHDLPTAAATYALNKEVAEAHRIRRYGAHGTSHQYVSEQVSATLGREDLRQIVLHLGNGCSASAVVGGRAVDTSMGLTPLEGLVMGTRTGDIDPAVTFHLVRNAGLSMAEIDDLYNKQSGLKGLGGHNDMRVIEELAEQGEPDASLALDVYVHRLRKYVGAYAAVMGGLDALAFSAGVGENSPIVRRRALHGLEFLGVALDEDRNEAVQRDGSIQVISAEGSEVTVLVVPTNEELSIAQQALAVI